MEKAIVKQQIDLNDILGKMVSAYSYQNNIKKEKSAEELLPVFYGAVL